MSIAGKISAFFCSPLAVRFVGELFFTMEGMRAQGALKIKDLKSVLVVKLDEIGDAVMLTPIIRELRGGLPDAWITLVVKLELKELWETCPYINEVVAFDRQTGFASLKSHRRAISFAKKELWNRRFDMAIVPRWDADYYGASFLAYFCGARHRVGYSEKVARTKGEQNRGYDRLFTLVSSYAGVKHESERNLDLLRGLGIKAESAKTELWVNENDMAAADGLLASHGVGPSERFVCLYPSGGSSVLKQWPIVNFVELGKWVVEQYGAKVLVAGGPGDYDVCAEVARGIGAGAVNVSGGLGLRVAAAVFKKCAMFVGNDTGPTHIAAAVGAPVVAIFGSSCPHRFAPTGDKCTVIWKAMECSACVVGGHADRCSKCVYEKPECLAAVTVGEVQEAVKAAIERRS